MLNARSRTDWHNGAGPTAWGSARPRRHAYRRGRRSHVQPSPQRQQPLASANDGGRRGGTAGGANRGMARWCGSSTSAERVGELGSSGAAAAAAAGQEAGRQAKWSGGVGLHARGRTTLKAGHGWSEQAPPLAAGVRAPRGGRAGGEGGLRAGVAAAWAWAGEAQLARAKRVAGGDVSQAGFGRGPKARRRPAKEKTPFSFIFSRNF